MATPARPGADGLAHLAAALRDLRRRCARRDGRPQLTVRQIAARTGYAVGAVSDYLTGAALPPTDRLDELARLFGATPAEQGALATARDHVEESRRRRGPGRRAPRELPPEVWAFVGRERELGELDGLVGGASGLAALADPRDPAMPAGPTGPAELGAACTPALPGIVVVSGPAGVGKTALVVRWAHRVGRHFPDGTLYLDLRGYDVGRPVSGRAALGALLRGLGAAGPPSSAALRTELAGRRALIVLDNARDAEQVCPLLPGVPGCLVVVTSRDSAAGLVVRHGARRLDLDVLPLSESAALLTALTGGRLDADPAAARRLALRCCGLPLALRLAAERLLATGGDAAALAEGLTAAPLDLLATTADRRTDVREVLSWSLRHLPPEAVRAFHVVGSRLGRRVDPRALAEAAGTTARRAAELLDALARAHLLRRGGGDRFTMHGLLRAYAAELGEPGLTASPAPR
ncbi:helix-turn-helix domain-containing protein [Actinosynnema mirum]|uniref:Transcriptional regulator, XRE family n=1 Tax=Actinosynnema mirum (strain ATCC 29888 / DSM 43827 / JCM 3225 / NBRC 14064 / NCIMB 13271 / NRRL B-12336 / IMRU 3971 / 101) TaxID=446462 RepID=C6WBP7_ACTMD|nr:helix-turn-helix domain-containing protein [Actinosynnema mirum]ACU35615.1 transcriptional regulator, XRE family [Actinosynnema mirum DSM 43827]